MWQTLGYRLRRGHRQEKGRMITAMEFRYNNEIDRGYCKRKGDSVRNGYFGAKQLPLVLFMKSSF